MRILLSVQLRIMCNGVYNVYMYLDLRIATKEPHSFSSSDESIVLPRHLSFDHLIVQSTGVLKSRNVAFADWWGDGIHKCVAFLYH